MKAGQKTTITTVKQPTTINVLMKIPRLQLKQYRCGETAEESISVISEDQKVLRKNHYAPSHRAQNTRKL